MAEDKKKRRVVKKDETIREKAAKVADAKPKPRRIRNTASKASTPLKAIGRFVAKVTRPFRFLLAPFKTKPVRFVGRILAKILFIDYIRNSWREVRKVQWPDRRSTLKLTSAVFVFAVTFALVISFVDFGLDKVFKEIILNK